MPLCRRVGEKCPCGGARAEARDDFVRRLAARAPSEEVDLLRGERGTKASKRVHSANSGDRKGPNANALRLLYERVCSRGAEVVRVPPGLWMST